MKKLKLLLYSLLVIVILVGVYFCIMFFSNNPEKKTMNADARKNVPGQFIQLPGGITHYESGGSDTAKTVILIHGFSVPYYIWDGTYDSLVNQGFHVIRYDEFGRGYSDRPDVVYDPLLYRKQLYDLIASLKLKTPVNLICVSFGGAIAGDFAVNYPELIDKMILIDPVYRFVRPAGTELVTNYKMAVGHKQQASGQLNDFKYPERFPSWVDKYKSQMQYKGFRHALLSTRYHYPGDSIISNYHSLGHLHKKILLIWGKEDQTVPFQYSDSIRQIIDVDFFPVDDARHLPYLEKPLLVNPKIIAFLKE